MRHLSLLFPATRGRDEEIPGTLPLRQQPAGTDACSIGETWQFQEDGSGHARPSDRLCPARPMAARIAPSRPFPPAPSFSMAVPPMSILRAAAATLAWLGRQGTRAIAGVVFIGIAVPPLGA